MKQQFDSIIFDMDGVLVSNSAYVKAIVKTVQVYCPSKKMRSVYIQEIKKITGFNNDWDTSYALIKLLGTDVPVEMFSGEVKQITPQVRTSNFYKQMKNTFQNFYIATNETRLIRLSVLKRLSKKYTLGIATSRPKYEALFAAQNLLLSQYIPLSNVVAKEDTPREKPYPDPLLEAKRRMNVLTPVYIGDTINDVVAAKRAGMPCIRILNPCEANSKLEELL